MDNRSKDAFRRAFSAHDAFGTTLAVAVLDLYGPEAVQWAPETLVHEIRDDFGVTLPHANQSKLFAALHLLSTDDFYKEAPTFNDIACALSGANHDPGTFVPLRAEEAAWAVTESLLLAPPDERDEEPFAADVRAYLGAVLKEEGILTPPDVLRIAEHDPHAGDRVRYDFADDPDMFGAIFSAQDEKTGDINNFVRGRLRKLMAQLESLPLTQGSADGLAKKLLAQLPAPQPE